MAKHCRQEGWTAERNRAKEKVAEKVIQKTAEKAADNATLAADIKRKGLLLLNRLFDEFANQKSTEHRDYDGDNVTDIKRLRDLTSAFKDLTEDLQTASNGNELLRSLLELERRAGL